MTNYQAYMLGQYFARNFGALQTGIDTLEIRIAEPMDDNKAGHDRYQALKTKLAEYKYAFATLQSARDEIEQILGLTNEQ